MKTFLVPFEETETVLVGYKAKINANSHEEAFDKLQGIIQAGESPHNFNDEIDGHFYTIEASVNTGIIEHVHSDCKYNMESYGLNDVKEVDERVSCKLDLTAFEIARYGNEELYNMAVAKFNKVGLSLEILEMEMIPAKIEEHFVSYDCIPTEYKHTFTDDDVWHMKDGVRLNTKGE
jgi:hypothetical protein